MLGNSPSNDSWCNAVKTQARQRSEDNLAFTPLARVNILVTAPTPKYISIKDVTELQASVGFAETMHCNYICLTPSVQKLIGAVSEGRAKSFLTTFVQKLRNWYPHPGFYAWVEEDGIDYGLHRHILLAVPTGVAARDVSDRVLHWFRNDPLLGINLKGGNLKSGALHVRPTSAIGWLGYVCKVSDTDRDQLLNLTGIRQNPMTVGRPPCVVKGRRIGRSTKLGPKARANASATCSSFII